MNENLTHHYEGCIRIILQDVALYTVYYGIFLQSIMALNFPLKRVDFNQRDRSVGTPFMIILLIFILKLLLNKSLAT